MPAPATSVMQCSSAFAIEALLQLTGVSGPILDTTYGNATFWKGSQREVIGCDINLERAKDVCCSFLNLPFRDNSFAAVIYDPPFHPNAGSAEAERYSFLGESNSDLQNLFRAGCRESFRVAEQFLFIKCQDFVNGSRVLWMPLWAVSELGEPWEWLTVWRPNKRVSGSWRTVRSLYRNHADWLVFSKVGPYHKAPQVTDAFLLS
jgi:hypothetical protein